MHQCGVIWLGYMHGWQKYYPIFHKMGHAQTWNQLFNSKFACQTRNSKFALRNPKFAQMHEMRVFSFNFCWSFWLQHIRKKFWMKVAEKHQKHSLWWAIQYWELSSIVCMVRTSLFYTLKLKTSIKSRRDLNNYMYGEWPKTIQKNVFSLLFLRNEMVFA